MKRDPRTKKRRMGLIILFLMVCTLCLSAYCLSKIIPAYIEYDYEHSLSLLELPKITEPSEIQVTIRYANRPPTDIRIMLSHTKAMLAYSIVTDEIENEITVICNTTLPADDYVLALMPQDNHELEYLINVLPSKDYIRNEIETSLNKNNDMILKIRAEYPYNDDDILVYVLASGNGFDKSSDTLSFKNNGSITLNMSRLFDGHLSSIDEFTVMIYQNETDENGRNVQVRQSKKELMRWDEK